MSQVHQVQKICQPNGDRGDRTPNTTREGNVQMRTERFSLSLITFYHLDVITFTENQYMLSVADSGFRMCVLGGGMEVVTV